MIVRDSTLAKSKRYTKKEFEEDLRRKFPQDAARNLRTTINKEIKAALIEEFSWQNKKFMLYLLYMR